MATKENQKEEKQGQGGHGSSHGHSGSGSQSHSGNRSQSSGRTDSHGGSQSHSDTSQRGFASMDNDKQRETASKGGQAVSQDKEHMSEIGRKGGEHYLHEMRIGN